MRFRRQLPVYSTLSLAAILRGLRAAIGGDRGARRQVLAHFEREYRPRALLPTDSGTTALRLALRAAFEHGRGPVALPAYCCFDVATASEGADVPVLLYDVDPRTLGPDWESLRAVLTDGATAVVVAHLYGIPVDILEVERLASEFGAVVIDDAAQGAGAEHSGRPVGSFGSLGVLSFGRGKGLTGGGGGLLLANDELGAELLESVRAVPAPGDRGWSVLLKTLAQWVFGRPGLYGIPASLPFLALGETRYRKPHCPRGMPAASWGVLERSIAEASEELARRRRNATRLLATLARKPTVRSFLAPQNSQSGFLRLPLLTASDGPFNRSSAVPLGIVRGYPKPLDRLAPMKERVANTMDERPGADELVASLITLPTHGLLQEPHVALIERALRDDG